MAFVVCGHSSADDDSKRKWDHLTPRRNQSPHAPDPLPPGSGFFNASHGAASGKRRRILSHIPYAASTLSPANQPNARIKSCGRPNHPALADERDDGVCSFLQWQDRLSAVLHKRAVRLMALNGDAGHALWIFPWKAPVLNPRPESACPIGFNCSQPAARVRHGPSFTRGH